jgi:basic membrane lipoprotein Med (substrate-binding protein (PBP1-ABC) superfamily)
MRKYSQVRRSLRRSLISILLVAAVTACSAVVSTTTATPVPTFTLVPSATPVPFAAIVSPANERTSAESLAHKSAGEFIAAQGWDLREMEPGAEILQMTLRDNPRMVVFVGSGMGEQITAAAASRPDLRFVAVEESGVTPAANLLVVGGENIRGDQAAFLAGLMAGINNQNDYVGWVGEANTVRGKSYWNGFQHGVHFVCPLCRIFDLELASVTDAQAGATAADTLAADYVDTASAIPSPAGTAALLQLARNQVRIAGAQPDFYADVSGGSLAGAAQILGSPVVRPDILLKDLLPRFAGGETFSAPVSYSIENSGLDFAPFPNEWMSTGRQAFLRSVLAEVASGRLDVGVDLQTGEGR